MELSKYKNNPLLPNLYYTDTDSAHFDGPLPSHFISSTILGQLKLEGIYDKALFLAPKVYALENSNESITKIKGLTKEAIKKNNITLDSLEILLNKYYNLNLNQRKWFRSIGEANINILEETYNLKVTGNKRELVYSEKDGKLIGTKPLNIPPCLWQGIPPSNKIIFLYISMLIFEFSFPLSLKRRGCLCLHGFGLKEGTI
jgi:hypothetical protein